MSTLAEEIDSLKRRIDALPPGSEDAIKLRGRMEGFRQRQLNQENLQIEIAKHIEWIEQTDDQTRRWLQIEADAEAIETSPLVYGE